LQQDGAIAASVATNASVVAILDGSSRAFRAANQMDTLAAILNDAARSSAACPWCRCQRQLPNERADDAIAQEQRQAGADFSSAAAHRSHRWSKQTFPLGGNSDAGGLGDGTLRGGQAL